ncbi:hypothetical protein GYA54_01645, partial [Candidatus Kuenenbacteria bacterium]|nr:hypothetical protein [Candidatus Kuenenbacteria bacterium]
NAPKKLNAQTPDRSNSLKNLYSSPPKKGLFTAFKDWGISSSGQKNPNTNKTPVKQSGFWGGWSGSSETNAAKPNLSKGSQPQPRTITELKKALLKEGSITTAERNKIIATTKEMAGYKYKDWQAKKVADNLIKNRAAHGFSSTDCRRIKGILIKKK